MGSFYYTAFSPNNSVLGVPGIFMRQNFFCVFTCLFFVFFFSSIPAVASFETYPEFYSLQESELEEGFEGPNTLGPEYASDILTYQRPVDWHLAARQEQIYIDSSWGSISPVHFQVQQQTKIWREIRDWFTFRFTYFADRDREIDQEHAIFETVFWPKKRWGVSLYGEPSLYKRQTDVGLALLHRMGKSFEARLFHTWVDLTRTKRNDRQDTYSDGRSPYAWGVVGRYSEKERNYELAYRRETPTQQIFLEENLVFDYQKDLLSFTLVHPFSKFYRFSQKFQADRKRESTVQGSDRKSWRTKRLQLWNELRMRVAWGNFSPGGQFSYRSWNTNAGYVRYQDYSVFLRFSRPESVYSWARVIYEVSSEVSFHYEKGDLALRGGTNADNRMEYRFNFSPLIAFTPKAKLRLQFTFDLDAIATKELWEGGNAQLQFIF